MKNGTISKLLNSLSGRTGAAMLAMGVVVILVVLKVIVSVITRSISISAQAMDSFLDLFSIGFTTVAVRMSVAPADDEHPFGHGKIEGISALIQAFLVLVAGAFIIYSSIQRIIHRTTISPDTGIVVMLISIVASFWLAQHLHRVAKATDSAAIEASARMIKADFYSAAGVLLGLVAVYFTKLQILDPIIALIMVVFVLKASYDIVLRAFRELIDYSLPEDEQEILNSCIKEHFTQLVDFHAVRSRRAGSERFVDLHLVMPRYVSVEDAHKMCDHLEQDIKDKLPNTNVVIHVEPCVDSDCVRCSITICTRRKPSQGKIESAPPANHP
jgi:cation diffusion facilitator family transporter